MKEKTIPNTSEGRAAFIAETLEMAPPARLLSKDKAPSREVLDFCRETGASLDFIFCGDLRPMVRRAYLAVQRAKEEIA